MNMYGLSCGRVNVIEDTVILLHARDELVLFECDDLQLSLTKSLLHKYFRLGHNLSEMYKQWNSCDEFFATRSPSCRGVRLLDQDPFEALISFICSQNNGINRITTMVHTLKSKYGDCYSYREGNCYSFPSPVVLAKEGIAVELKNLGFGYRAEYIENVSKMIVDGRLDLNGLRSMEYENVVKKLILIPGIGPKVADCVALTGLGQMSAVPIDTHIWQVACTHYPGITSGMKTLNRKIYQEIGDMFRKLWGPRAGWAHLVLFASQIRNKRKIN